MQPCNFHQGSDWYGCQNKALVEAELALGATVKPSAVALSVASLQP